MSRARLHNSRRIGRRLRGWKGFLPGLIAGVVVATAAVSIGAVPQRQWEKKDSSFRLGYVIGFFDAAMLARNLDAGGYVDTTYPVFKEKVSWYEWVDEVNKAFEEKGDELPDVPSALAHAASALRDKYEVATAVDRFKGQWKLRTDLQQKLKAAREAGYEAMEGQEAAKQGDGQGAATDDASDAVESAKAEPASGDTDSGKEADEPDDTKGDD